MVLVLIASSVTFSQTTGTVSIARGPYLNAGSQTGITIRWRTDAPSDSKVDLGTAPGSYTISVADPAVTTEHVVRVNSLSPDTKYYYRVGTTSVPLQAGNDQFFVTSPPRSVTRKIRIAAFGDCGRNDNSFQTQTLNQYRNYLAANGIEASDAWILLGDNAYHSGTDAEYTNNFFGVYGSTILKNHKLYPVPGNHDYANSSSRQDDHAVPYYQIFSVPSGGEAGGIASGNPAYYSYDVGNIHFLALDSYGEEDGGTTRIYDTTGAQTSWIKADLAANTNKWTIAYWHHPPYTMGSHNSDTESELVNMRTRLIRILERLGVDMIICGHSHDYERSYLLNGHYGTEGSFNPSTHALSNSSGYYDGSANSCPYITDSNTPNHGTVYVVAGSSGADGGVQAGYPHNAMPFSVDDGGMLYFEVEDNRLDAKFIRRDGAIADRFTIMKDVSDTTAYTVVYGHPVTLTASWNGTYSWSTGATTRSITVTPAAYGTSTYTVLDNGGSTCISDVFHVTVSSALPVVFSDFTATSKDDKVQLKWTTAIENNNRQFIVERSSDAVTYFPLGHVAGSGTTTGAVRYVFTDDQPLYKENFYRLRILDASSQASFSPVRKVNFPFYIFNVKNVGSSEGKLTVEVISSQKDAIRLQVYDVSGRKVIDRKLNVPAGNTFVPLVLQPGTYIIQLKNSQEIMVSQKVNVQ